MPLAEPAYLVGTGGAIGAILRYGVANFLLWWRGPHTFPVSTVVVNVIGSFVLGLVIFTGSGDESTLLIGVGACGAFTTYSSFSVQTVRLWEDGKHGYAIVNAIGNLVCSVTALGLAWLLVS